LGWRQRKISVCATEILREWLFFVICELQKPVEDFLDQHSLLEMMNVTPTQSEAWDIVQMEEIEREMFGEYPA
jgi:hypothetical protein